MRKKRIPALIIFFGVYIAYMSIYVARVNLSVAGPELKNMKLLDSAQIGILGSCFFAVYAAGRMINGSLSDFLPPWAMISSGLVLSGVSNILISFFPPFAAMSFLWIVNALAQSMLWSSVLCVVSSIYDRDKVKKKASLMVTSVASGNVLGIVVNTFVIKNYGVKAAFAVPGAIALFMALVIFVLTKDVKNISEEVPERKPILKLLKNKELVTMDIIAVIHGVMKENISLWMAVYIVDTYCVDLTKSSIYVLLIPLIGLGGRMVYPFLYKICGDNENRVSLLGFVVCVAAAVILCLGKTTIAVSAVCLGIIYMAVSVINTSVVSIFPLSFAKSGNTASVSGIMDFSTYIGAGVSSAVYGSVIKHFGYLPMFVSWVLISLMSIAVLLKFLKRN